MSFLDYFIALHLSPSSLPTEGDRLEDRHARGGHHLALLQRIQLRLIEGGQGVEVLHVRMRPCSVQTLIAHT